MPRALACFACSIALAGAAFFPACGGSGPVPVTAASAEPSAAPKPKMHAETTPASSVDAHDGAITSIAWGKSGKILATGSEDETAKLWDVAAHTIKCELGAPYGVTAVAISPDEKRVLVASAAARQGITYGKLVVFDATTCKEAGVLLADARLVDDAAWSSDGKTVAALESGAKKIHLFDAGTWKDHPLDGPESASSVAFVDDGRLAIGSDVRAFVVDLATRAIVVSVDTRANAIATTADGRALATAADEGGAEITLWNASSGARLESLASFEGTGGALAFSNDGRLLASGAENAATTLWNVAHGAPIQTLRANDEGITAVAFSPDGALLATGGEDGTLLLWQME